MGNTPRSYPLHTPLMTPAVPRKRARTPLVSVEGGAAPDADPGAEPAFPTLTAAELASGQGKGELLVDVPWAADPAYQAGVAGGLLAIPVYAGLKGVCTISKTGATNLRFEIRWSRK